MAKSAKRRHHAERLRNKWLQLLKRLSPERSLECATFGRVYSRDPFDCGNPQCALCSFGKVTHRKEKRLKQKREVAQEVYDFDYDSENRDTPSVSFRPNKQN